MIRLIVALAATVVVGLVSRLHPVGWYLYDRALGEVLYAVAAYLVLAMLLFRKPLLLIAVLAWACCLAVELFKLTGIPAEHQRLFLVRWFLGMTFSYLNLVYYFIGVLLIASADRATRTHQETKTGQDSGSLIGTSQERTTETFGSGYALIGRPEHPDK